MTMHQLYVYGVEYKDYFYRIVGSYWHKEKAEEVKLKMEAEKKRLREQVEKCNTEIMLKDFDESMYCSSLSHNRDELFFEIKEAEVEE